MIETLFSSFYCLSTATRHATRCVSTYAATGYAASHASHPILLSRERVAGCPDGKDIVVAGRHAVGSGKDAPTAISIGKEKVPSVVLL